MTFRDVERWLARRPVSRPTQRTHLVALRAWYWWALREGLCEHDPTALVDGPRLDRRLRARREVDITMVLAGAGPQMAAMIAVMSCAGLRCCEVARLRWEDVDLAGGSIFVFGKGSKERRVWLGRGRAGAPRRATWHRWTGVPGAVRERSSTGTGVAPGVAGVPSVRVDGDRASAPPPVRDGRSRRVRR